MRIGILLLLFTVTTTSYNRRFSRWNFIAQHFYSRHFIIIELEPRSSSVYYMLKKLVKGVREELTRYRKLVPHNVHDMRSLPYEVVYHVVRIHCHLRVDRLPFLEHFWSQ